MQEIRAGIVLLVGFARADVIRVGRAVEFDELVCKRLLLALDGITLVIQGVLLLAQELGGSLYRSFEAVVEDAGTAGLLRTDARTTAQALWAGCHGVVSLVITKPYFDWVERETLVTTLLEGLFAGLLKS